MAIELVYETHATTTDNEVGIATGWLPGRLSELGRRQAVELGERRRQDTIAAVFTSDLRRSVETADLAFGGTDLRYTVDTRLRECDYGVHNGTPAGDLARIRRAHIATPFPGGQSYQDVVRQTADFLRELAERSDGTRVLIIAHTANRWALDHLLDGVPLEDLVEAPFNWQPGWEYALPSGWGR